MATANPFARVPTRTATGEVRERAQKVDARSPQAKAQGLSGARYDAFGNLAGGKSTTTGTQYRPGAGESGIDRFKQANNMEPGAGQARTSWGQTVNDARASARLRETSNATERGNQRIAAESTGRAVRVGQARGNARYAAFQAGMKERAASGVREAGNLARSPEGSGLRYTAQTPYGTVGVRNGAPPTPGQPPTRTAAAMPPGGPNLNPRSTPTPPASMARSGPGTTMPTWAQSAPRSTSTPAAAPRGLAPAVAANRERLKAGDAVAKGMFGKVSEPFLPKVGRAAMAVGKAAVGVAKAKTAFDVGLAKSAASGLRKFQKQGLIATAR